MVNAAPPGGLGAIVQFDDQSRAFNISTTLEAAGIDTKRSNHWPCLVNLDQGQEGACVGFGWSAELAASPIIVPADNPSAFALYHEAQALDGWPIPHEGSSVLAGAKATQARGNLDEYRWAFNFDDLELVLGNYGPVVLGINWYTGMDHPDPATGLIAVSGTIRGRHCLLANGISPRLRLVHLHNSWGNIQEHAISYDDLKRLLSEQGEACIPVRRR